MRSSRTDMLAALKVRYSWNLSAAPHLGERPESAPCSRSLTTRCTGTNMPHSRPSR